MKRMLVNQRLGSFLAVLVSLLIAPHAAEAAMTYSASGPPTLTLPGAQTITYTLNFENSGPATEEVTVNAGKSAPALPRQGFTMDQVGAAKLTNLVGTSSIIGGVGTHVSFARGVQCLVGTPDAGPYGLRSEAPTLSIPAGARGSVSFDFRVGDLPPRAGESFAPTFSATTNGGTQALPAPEPVLLGQMGTLISVQASVKRKRKLIITGSTSPARPGQVMNLQMDNWTKFEPTYDLGTTVTDGAGGFRAVRSLPKRASTYLIGATYRSQRSDLADDRACPGASILLPARPKAKSKKKRKRTRKG